MKNGLVVKDNALINASYNLEVTEQRLILLAIISARETGAGITSDSKLEIYASDHSKQFNVTKEASYKALKSAVNNLFERQFSFQEETKKGVGTVRSRWVSRIKYIDDSAILEITFAPDVVPLITRLEKHFTSYQIIQVAQLTGKYAIRLYELLIAWREVGKVPPLELSEFRKQLGVEDHEYKAMNHFKSRVLEPSIKQINEHTDIIVTYEQHKKGRLITGFSFKFKQKKPKQAEIATETPQTASNASETIKPLTEPQIAKYSMILCKLGSISDLSNFPDYPTFANWLGNILRNPEKADEQIAKRIFKVLKTETDYSKQSVKI